MGGGGGRLDGPDVGSMTECVCVEGWGGGGRLDGPDVGSMTECVCVEGGGGGGGRVLARI